MMNRSLPQTILMTADTVGGVWTYALELAKALGEYDITVYLATMGETLSKSQWNSADAIPNLEIAESDYDLEWMDDPWEETRQAGEWLLELEEEIQPDLVHLNNFVHGSLPWNAPVLVAGHSCVLSWWQAVKKEKTPDEWNEYAGRVRKGLQEADCVVGVSRNMLKSLEEHYGPFGNSAVVYNARDENMFSPAAKKPVIFSMGRLWDEAKNISVLEAVSDQLSWPVYIAGEHRGKLTESKNLTLLGKISSEEVVEWLSISSIFVLPARYEPFGLSALEAAHSGCALVLGDIPTLKEVWGQAAMFADPECPIAVRHQTEGLIRNAAKRQAMARKAMLRAQRYSLKQFAEKYLALYIQLLEGRTEKMVAE